jgi:hypothetical protein
MGGYDQFISLLFCVLQIIYVSFIHLCCFILSGIIIRGTPKTPNLSW